MSSTEDSDRTQPPKKRPAPSSQEGASASGEDGAPDSETSGSETRDSEPRESGPPDSGAESEETPTKPDETVDLSGDRTTAMKTRRQPVLGGFPIEEKIGEGGMGIVYRAFDPDLHRTVALKKIHPRLAGDDEFALRFTQEACAIAAVSHTNIAQIHSIHARNEDEPAFMVMEYVDGPALDQFVKEAGSLEVAKAVELTLQAARGLRAAHQQGLVHSDVKPSNILTTRGGSAKLVDFGLACRLGDQLAARAEGEEALAFGTPHYASPEQIRGLPLDHRADIYSLGCTLYFMLVGEELFKGKTTADLIAAHCSEAPPRITERRSDVPAALDSTLQRMLAKRAENRYQSYDPLISDLTRILQQLRPTPKQWASTAASVLVVIAIAAVVWFATRQWQSTRASTPIDLANYFGLPFLEPDGLRGEGLQLDFSNTKMFTDARSKRLWDFPLEGQEQPNSIVPWIDRKTHQLQWRNYPHPVTFPAYSDFEFVELEGLQIDGNPDFEIVIGHDPDRPGNELRVSFGVGQRNSKIVELWIGGERIPLEGLDEPLLPFSIKQGLKHTVRLVRDKASPSGNYTFDLVIQQHNPNEERQDIVQQSFKIPAHALPRGHLILRGESYRSSIWTVNIDEIVVRGKLDQERIRRSLL